MRAIIVVVSLLLAAAEGSALARCEKEMEACRLCTEVCSRRPACKPIVCMEACTKAENCLARQHKAPKQK